MSKASPWDIDACLRRIAPSKGALCDSFRSVARHNIRDEDVTDTMLEECYIMMANIVKDHGELYLPIFERLHEELKIRKSKKDLIGLAHRVSREAHRDQLT